MVLCQLPYHHDPHNLTHSVSLWATEPNRVVKFKKKKIFPFFDKNQCKYIGIDDIWPEQVGTSHFRPPMGPKTAKNGHYWLFSQFVTHLPIFLAGTRWNSPLKVKSEAMLGLSPAKKVT